MALELLGFGAAPGSKGGVIETKEKDEYNEDVVGFPILECDYDIQPHSLFESIQNRRWARALRLCTMDAAAAAEGREDEQAQGAAPADRLSGLAARRHQDIPRSKVLAMTWVVRRNAGDGSVKWRITPLIAALIFDAPLDLLRALLDLHPPAARLKDDMGNLPLHVAFGSDGLREDAIRLLLDAYPEGIDIKNAKGKTPLECAGVGLLACVSHVLGRDGGSLLDERLAEAEGRMLRAHREAVEKVRDEGREEMERLRGEHTAEVRRVRDEGREEAARVREELAAEVRKLEDTIQRSGGWGKKSSVPSIKSMMAPSIKSMSKAPKKLTKVFRSKKNTDYESYDAGESEVEMEEHLLVESVESPPEKDSVDPPTGVEWDEPAVFPMQEEEMNDKVPAEIQIIGVSSE